MPALISNIQKFSVDDGPGIRTTVFFKGCNLSCAWCHNPECINPKQALQFVEAACKSCRRCEAVCTQKVHSFTRNKHHVNRALCTSCGACLNVCLNDALSLNGKNYDIDQLLAILLQDKAYYEESSGGVTFSGGEPMLQLDFLYPLLKRCKKEGLSTAVDTAGNVPWSSYEKVLPYTDYFLYDIKAFTPSIHKKFTGVNNTLIQDNILQLAANKARIIVRVPVIPTANNSPEEMEAIAHFLTKVKPTKVELLPYHAYGTGKYFSYDIPYKLKEIKPPTTEEMESLLQLFLKHNLPAVIS